VFTQACKRWLESRKGKNFGKISEKNRGKHDFVNCVGLTPIPIVVNCVGLTPIPIGLTLIPIYAETDGKETSASVRVGISRCGSEYNRGTGCGKTATDCRQIPRIGRLCEGYRVTGIPATTVYKK